MSDNPVVHFEMPYKDGKRVAEFYKAALGWEMNGPVEDMGGYIIAGTADTDEDRMVKTPGTINGGFYSLSDAPQSAEPSVVVSVKDINKAIEDIKQTGGTVMQDEPIKIPGIGLYVSMKDTEGNRVGILQANERG
jgi:predicted enzyme related to lactoylglutathione lyase